MRDSLLEVCTSYSRNKEVVRSAFPFDSSYMHPVCAAIFTDKKKEANAERIRECKEILKAQTGVFSNFRGTAKPAMISMLAVDSYPERKMEKSLEMYKLLKEKFYTSSYLPLTAMILADLAEEGDYQRIADKTRQIYELMKKEHPFLTSAEDSIYAGLLALSDRTKEALVEETERCFENVKDRFYSKNAIQSLSHVLALGDGSAESKCSRTIEIFDQMKEQGMKYGTSYELATLGVLAQLPGDVRDIVNDMAEIDAFLEKQKGYGIFGVGKKQRYMHAGMLLTSDLLQEEGNTAMSASAVSGTVALIAAQQAALCAAIAASSAAASTAATS